MGQSSLPAPCALARPVVLLMPDRATGRSYLRALQRATVAVEWVRTVADLEALTKRSADQIPPVVLVVPSQNERFDAQTFADIASRLSAQVAAAHGSSPGTQGWRHHLDQAFRAYCVHRALSPRQERVLALYLAGSNDKEMADAFGCSEATVYEHWRRMARKASGFHKWDVVADFHRFLAGAGGNDVVPEDSKVEGAKSATAKVDFDRPSPFASRRNG